MQKVFNIVDKTNDIVKVTAGILIGLMAITISIQIFTRFLLGFSLSWSEELSRYLSIYAVFLGAAVALRSQSLISVEVLHEFIPAKVSKWLKVIVYLICIFFFFLLLFKGIEMVGQVHNQKSPSLQIPMSIPYASVPIGASLLIVNSVTVILELIKGGEK